MPYRCLPPFRTSHFTGDVTAIEMTLKLVPWLIVSGHELEWGLLSLCLSSTQIGRTVWAETLHVEFHPKIRPGNPSLQDPAGCQPHPRRTIINRGIYDFCLLFVSMHASYWFCPSPWAGAHLTDTGTALVRLTWAYTTTIESMDFEIWPPWLSDGGSSLL